MTGPAPLPDLPEVITRAQIRAALQALGLPPEQLLSVRLHRYGVECDLFALNARGDRYFLGSSAWSPDERDRDYDRLATHRVCIPVGGPVPPPGGDAEPPGGDVPAAGGDAPPDGGDGQAGGEPPS